MDNKDHLKEILDITGQIHEPIDLEAVILKSIQEKEYFKNQIAKYKTNGVRALLVTAVLIIILAIFYSLPDSVQSFEYSFIKYTSIILVLLVLFIQLEISGTHIFNSQRNKTL